MIGLEVGSKIVDQALRYARNENLAPMTVLTDWEMEKSGTALI